VTYFQYHLLFNLTALFIVLALSWKRFRRAHFIAIGVISVIAFTATSPWDNWAVYRGIWGFDWSRVTPVEFDLFGKHWRLPLEEYAFFIIETVLVGMLLVRFLPKPANTDPSDAS